MANKQDYIAVLAAAICRLNSCGAAHLKTVSVREITEGWIMWSGDVEVFNLVEHPKAKRAYAWWQMDGQSGAVTRLVMVLEVPPVTSAESAVRTSLVMDLKGPA